MFRDKKTYVGCTSDLKDRIKRHQKGHVPSTKDRGPIELIFYCAFVNEINAFKFERYLKSASGRAFTSKRLI